MKSAAAAELYLFASAFISAAATASSNVAYLFLLVHDATTGGMPSMNEVIN
jgi:hypothetical protein